jgi:hypothetical protein
MSSRGSARERTDVHAGRIQHKWTTLLRRAHARESALQGALAHARTTEAELRLQLEREQRRHTAESGLLRERLQRLEQCLLSLVAAGRRGILRPPLAAHRFSATAAHDTAAASPPAMGKASPEAHAPAPVPPAPFDPVATVAALLPLSQAQTGAPAADITGALDRLQAVVRGTGPGEADTDPAIRSDLGQHPVPAPAAQTHGEQLEHPPAVHSDRPEEDRATVSDTPWFPRAFRRLAGEDPTAAGRLFLQLLPAQGLVWPEDVKYRIEVAETGTLAIDVRAGTATVLPLLESSSMPNAGEPALRTDLAGLARTVAGRRGWSRVGARIAHSRNRHLRPLRALAAAPLQLSDLERTGVRADPVLLLRLLALAIDPAWTAQETFTLACRWSGQGSVRSCYIHVFESAPVAVTNAPPLGRVTATLSCAPDDLLDILLGDIALGDSSAQVSGDHAAFTSLLEWFQQVDATAIRIPSETAVVAA